MADLITAMRMGDAIPEWLLVAEPVKTGAPRGNFRFALDVHIVDTPDYFVVIPMHLGNLSGIIDASGMIEHRVYAAGKPVHMVNAQNVVWPLEVNSWHSNADPNAMNPATVATQPAPLKSPTFWQRLRWLFRGT